jgi:protein gp37
MTRYGKDFRVVRRTKPATFNGPLKWEEPKLIFTCSWSDWFIEEADPWRDEAWDIIRKTPWHTYQLLTKRPERFFENLPKDWDSGWPNVWLGVSIENEDYLYRRHLLCALPAKLRFLSLEPLLGPLNLGPLRNIDWVITGGESGPNARPMDPDWVRDIRDQCVDAGVPFFHKQHGGSRKINGSWGGRMLDGRTWDEMPQREKRKVKE